MNAICQCLFQEHDAGNQLLIQDWSLGVELKASALLPLFIFLSRWLTPWSLLAVSVPLVTLLPTGHYYATFILGVLLASTSGSVLQWLHSKPFLVKAGLLVAGLVLYGTRHAGRDMLGHQAGVKYYWLGTGVGCALILLGACLAAAFRPYSSCGHSCSLEEFRIRSICFSSLSFYACCRHGSAR